MYTEGVLQADSGVIREHDHIFRLFCHECQRVFHDRFIDRVDKKFFYGILSEMASKHFQKASMHTDTHVLLHIRNVHVHTHTHTRTHTHTVYTHTHTLTHTSMETWIHGQLFIGAGLVGAHSRQDGGVAHCLWWLHEDWSTQIRQSVWRTLQHQEGRLRPHRRRENTH